jgi:hypothetical protein
MLIYLVLGMVFALLYSPMHSKTTYHIIAAIRDVYSETIECFDTPEEAKTALKEIKDPDSFDSYYSDLLASGGSLRLEDSEGNEF